MDVEPKNCLGLAIGPQEEFRHRPRCPNKQAIGKRYCPMHWGMPMLLTPMLGRQLSAKETNGAYWVINDQIKDLRDAIADWTEHSPSYRTPRDKLHKQLDAILDRIEWLDNHAHQPEF